MKLLAVIATAVVVFQCSAAASGTALTYRGTYKTNRGDEPYKSYFLNQKIIQYNELHNQGKITLEKKNMALKEFANRESVRAEMQVTYYLASTGEWRGYTCTLGGQTSALFLESARTVSVTPFGGGDVFIYPPDNLDWYAKSAGRILLIPNAIESLPESLSGRLPSAFGSVGPDPALLSPDIEPNNGKTASIKISPTDTDTEELHFEYRNAGDSFPISIRFHRKTAVTASNSQEDFLLQDISLELISETTEYPPESWTDLVPDSVYTVHNHVTGKISTVTTSKYGPEFTHEEAKLLPPPKNSTSMRIVLSFLVAITTFAVVKYAPPFRRKKYDKVG